MSENNGMSDKVKSKVSKVKGEAKEQYGNAAGNKEKEREGKQEKVKSDFQKKKGEFKDKL
jgi:uncharacterized protein YjbJ (UPF0337 family)